jgi:hypothetical protein
MNSRGCQPTVDAFLESDPEGVAQQPEHGRFYYPNSSAPVKIPERKAIFL